MHSNEMSFEDMPSSKPTLYIPLVEAVRVISAVLRIAEVAVGLTARCFLFPFFILYLYLIFYSVRFTQQAEEVQGIFTVVVVWRMISHWKIKRGKV